jgi:hypothetical protein
MRGFALIKAGVAHSSSEFFASGTYFANTVIKARTYGRENWISNHNTQLGAGDILCAVCFGFSNSPLSNDARSTKECGSGHAFAKGGSGFFN